MTRIVHDQQGLRLVVRLNKCGDNSIHLKLWFTLVVEFNNVNVEMESVLEDIPELLYL